MNASLTASETLRNYIPVRTILRPYEYAPKRRPNRSATD
jgi:hypothetical protein